MIVVFIFFISFASPLISVAAMLNCSMLVRLISNLQHDTWGTDILFCLSSFSNAIGAYLTHMHFSLEVLEWMFSGGALKEQEVGAKGLINLSSREFCKATIHFRMSGRVPSVANSSENKNALLNCVFILPRLTLLVLLL